METNIFVVAVYALLFVAFFSIGHVLLSPSSSLRQRVFPYSVGSESPQEGGLQRRSEKLIKRLGSAVPHSVASLSRMRRRLIHAGIRRKDGPILFYGAQGLTVLSLLGLFLASGYFWPQPLLCVVFSVFLGSLLPDLWLSRRIQNRKESITLALPDALDLMMVCVEAGLGLDQTINRVSAELAEAHPDLTEELQLYILEVNAGSGRIEALRNLADRTDTGSIKSLVGVLVQTDRFGTSIGEALRTFADTLRTDRRLRAEERAAKIPVKIVFPLVLFVFPGILIVIAGPAIIAIIRLLFPALTGEV